jgi:hypothetical protein
MDEDAFDDLLYHQKQTVLRYILSNMLQIQISQQIVASSLLGFILYD